MPRSDKRRLTLFRHAAIKPPWEPLGAHALSAVSVVAVSIGTAILIGLVDFAIASAFGIESGPNRPLWRRWADEVLVYLLVAWVSFLYHLIFFLPLYMIALWRGVGGALSAAIISAVLLGGFSAATVDPAWIGISLGLFYGGIYGLVFHPLRLWFLGRPPTRKT